MVPDLPQRPTGSQHAHVRRDETDSALLGSRAGDWPAVQWEERSWDRSTDRPAPPRRQLRLHTGPYISALVPQIADLDAPLPAAVLAGVDEATVEITRFDAEVGARLAPFGALLLRSESAASSQIEQLTASAKAIATAEIGDASRNNASQIVANTRAMRAAIDLADRLDQQAILDMHAVLIEPVNPEWVGHWRDQPVWIGGTPYGPHQADFVPPHQDRVPAAMDDLVAYLQRDDIPVLVQAAIAHAQFETIHPFPDGNGRVGRSLVHSLLRAKGLTRSIVVPVSAGLLANTGAYFDALGAYREGRPAPIVGQFADAAWRSIDNGRRLVAELDAIRDAWQHRITARSDASAWRVADLLVQQPVIDARLVQDEFGVSAPVAQGAIKQLVDAQVLSQSGGGARYRRWAATEVLEALDTFARRIGRRGQG